jgi:hypothetical protein
MSSGARQVSVAPSGIVDRLMGVGSKYLPSIKDLKAGERFRQKQHVQSKFIKPAAKGPTKPSKKK